MDDLSDRCSIVTNIGKDDFVGIRIHSNNIEVHFPLGFSKPEADSDIRAEILNLFQVLKRFSKQEKGTKQKHSRFRIEESAFPITAYLDVIHDFFRRGYYIERERVYQVNGKGTIDWKRTIHTQKPLFQDDEAFYTSFVVRRSLPDSNRLITIIHQYCVYESFAKLGWLFTDFMPEKPKFEFNRNLFSAIVVDKLNNTNNDSKKKLFNAMLQIIHSLNANNDAREFTYGTDDFEYVWERLVDYVFGIENKADYFPKTRWRRLQSKEEKGMKPLEPDTLMEYNERFYVLDAKYYKFGVTGINSHLPSSASINKQITYGEYVQKKSSEKGMVKNTYNAFIMPFNKNNNKFGLSEPIGFVGEAIGEWRDNKLPYERIQGFVVDIKFLMHAYMHKRGEAIVELAGKIDKAIQESAKINPPLKIDD